VAEGPEKEVFFTQDHKPGEALAVDWTVMDSLGVIRRSIVGGIHEADGLGMKKIETVSGLNDRAKPHTSKSPAQGAVHIFGGAAVFEVTENRTSADPDPNNVRTI